VIVRVNAPRGVLLVVVTVMVVLVFELGGLKLALANRGSPVTENVTASLVFGSTLRLKIALLPRLTVVDCGVGISSMMVANCGVADTEAEFWLSPMLFTAETT
jgi:hypothetical protein